MVTGSAPPREIRLVPLKARKGVSLPPPPLPPQHVLTPNNIRQGASWRRHECDGLTVWKRECSDDKRSRRHVAPLQCSCEEDSTEHPGFLEPPEPLHDPDGLLDPLFGVQFTSARVRRREVAISAQPILDTNV